MRSIYLALMCVALVLAAPGLVRAEPPETEHPGSVVLILDGKGGAFDVAVHPDLVTVLYMPGPIKNVIGSDEQRFATHLMDDSVVLRPSADVARDARGNVSIDTEEFKISVVLHVAESADQAVSQVFFRPRAEVERFNSAVTREVERRYAAVKEHFEARRRGLDREVVRTTEKRIAERLLQRHTMKKIDRRERNDDNVIVHVRRGVWVGSELYLIFEIQNRDRKAYRFAELHVTGYDRTKERAGIVQFRSSEYPEKGTIGIVPAGASGHGIVCVRNADRIAGEPITLVVSEPKGKRAIKIEGIRW
jgi:hypothetical protein